MLLKNKVINLINEIKKPKIIWLGSISLLVSFFGLLLPKISHGILGIETLASKIVTYPIVLIGEIISFIAGQIITLEAAILDAVVSGSKFTTLMFVQKGWASARDIANLFFIAILIYIAFAIILKLQTVNAKKLLFKVITTAVIINFSLMIGGMVIDFSQVLFRFFLFGGLEEGASFSSGLAKSLDIQKYWSAASELPLTDDDLPKDMLSDLSFTKQLLVRITQAFTKSALMCVTVFVFGAIGLVLIIRNIWLWVLLITAPIAWFISIVPLGEISSLGKKWWGNFIKWAFIAPIMGFFIYLVLMIGSKELRNTPLINVSEDNLAVTKGMSFDAGGNFNLINILQFIIVIGLMVGSLMAGQSLGLKAANSAIGMATKAGKNTQKWMGRKAMQTKPVQAVGNKLMQWGNAPIIGGVFKRAGMATQRGVVGARGEDLKKADSRIKYMNDDQLKKNFNIFNDREKQAAAKKLGFDKLSQEQFEAMQKVYSRQGYEKEFKDLQKAHPYWTDDFKKSAEKIKIEVEFKGAEAEFNKVKESGKNADSTEYKNAETKYKSAEAKYTANKKDIEDAKANVADKFKEFDVSKMAVNFDRPAFNDPNSAEFNTLAVALAEKPFKDGIGKAIQKILIKKDGRVDGQKTAVIRRDLVMKAAGHIYTSNGMGSEGLEAVEKFCKKPLSGSPSAHVGGYTHKDVNKYLEKEFGAKLEETSEKNTKTIKRQAGFTPQGFTIEGNSVISPEPEKKSSSGSSSEVNDEEDEEEEVVKEKKEGEVSGEEKGGSEETEENKEGKSEEKK